MWRSSKESEITTQRMAVGDSFVIERGDGIKIVENLRKRKNVKRFIKKRSIGKSIEQ